MTNEQYIRTRTSRRELAAMLIVHKAEEDWDYDWDENSYLSGYIDIWIASDGT